MVSMKDIAQHCGVSVATVSKALNGQPDIGPETRSRVCAAADEMGYLTNAAAKALKTNRTYNLGVLHEDRRGGLTHEYFAGVLESFKNEAESRGYDITFINKNVGGRSTSYLQHCRYRGLDGVLITSADYQDPQVRELVGSNVPLVTIDHVINDRLAVISDNLSGLENLVHYAYGMGHRQIAFLHGERNLLVTRNRLTGFYRACEELGLDVPPEYVRECIYHNPEKCAAETRALLALPQRPTCIIFPDDYSFIGGHRELMYAGLRIPDDISALGYDGIQLASVMNLTTYAQNDVALGRTAAQQLINLIERPKTTYIECFHVQGGLQIGASVRDIR